MTITVEDGTGLEDAVSYVAVADADAYHSAAGNSGWSGSEDVKEKALVRATRFVEQRFQRRFVGTRASYAQALSWPRDDAVSRDGFELVDMVPKQLKDAVCEYALRALTAALLPDPTGGATAGGVKRQRNKVGSLETETEWVEGSSPSMIPAYPAADLLLVPILRNGSGRVSR